MSTVKTTNVQHGSATNTNLVLASTGTAQFYNTISVGNTTPSSSGAGVTFPATQSASTDANTLDDYEEGTFTPTDTSGGGYTFSTARGRYTKIGREVTCYIVVDWPSNAGGQSATIGSLPFTSANPYGSGDAGFGGSISYTNSTLAFTSFMGQNTTNAIFYNTSGASITNANLSLKQVQLVLKYFTS